MLATSLVPVNVDPDELVAPSGPMVSEAPAVVPGAPPPPPEDAYDWSQWVNVPTSNQSQELGPGEWDAAPEQTPVEVADPAFAAPSASPDEVGGDLAWAPQSTDDGGVVADSSPWAATQSTPGSDAPPPPDGSVFVVPPVPATPLPPLEPQPDFLAGAAPNFGSAEESLGTQDVTDGQSQALEPHSSESGGIWQAGPAPAEPQAADDAPPSGLEPVSWYQEPEVGAAAAFATGPSLFGGGDERADPPQHDFFAEPLIAPPSPPPPPGGTIEPVGQRIEFTPAADGWGADGDETSTSSRGQAALSHEARLIAMAILLVAVLALTAYFLNGRGDSYPANWTGNMGKLATTVSKSRGLEFKHPVGVLTLPPGDYATALESHRTVTDAKDKQLEADHVASFRALGVVVGDPTLTLPSAVLVQPGDHAFYDLKDHQLVVRAGTATLRDNVAVIGALSVALDDQWGKLGSLTGLAADEQLTSVVAGDAALARSDYVDGLPMRDRLQVQAAIDADAKAAAPTLFPDVLAALRAATGHALVQTVHDVDGTDGVHRLLQFPPTSDNQITNPAAYFSGTGALQVPAPALPANATLIDQGSLGATNAYLMLASRIDPISALDISDLWAGDAFTRYRQTDGRVCIAVAFRGESGDQAATMAAALEKWKAALPADQAKVGSVGTDLVTATACDPGAAKATPVRSLAPAMELYIARSQLSANYYRAGTKKQNGPNGPLFTTDEAWCMANNVVHSVALDQLNAIVAGQGVYYRTVTLAAGQTCRSTVADILFTPN